MDPLSVAAKRFLRDLQRIHKRRPMALARLLARETDRADVVKILRLSEYSLTNRRPLFLFEAPFEGPAAYFDSLSARAAGDYSLVREGVAEEGISLPSLDLPPRAPSTPPEAHALSVLSAISDRLTTSTPSGSAPRTPQSATLRQGPHGATSAQTPSNADTPPSPPLVAQPLSTPFLEGALAVLAPRSITDAAEWRRSIERLARSPRAESLRLCVLDLAPLNTKSPPRPLTPEDGPLASLLGPETATFTYDLDDLFDHAEQQVSRTSNGPPVPAPPPLPEAERAALEQAGIPLPDPKIATEIQTVFLRAARAMAKGDFKSAIDLYRRARDLCREERLSLQEAGAAFALAGAYLSAGARPMAQATYGQAALLAAEQKHWILSSQSKLGEAGVAWMDRDWPRAARAYSEAATLAERGGLVPLQIEAHRMEGLAHQSRGHEPDAITAWRRAIDAGTAADDPTRRASTFPDVVKTLADLLEKRGLRPQATHLRSLLERPPPSPTAHPERR